MLALLQNLHLIAANRGDGLRPEFLKTEAEAPLRIVFPRTDAASYVARQGRHTSGGGVTHARPS